MRLVLAAHGSADRGLAATVEAIAARVRGDRPGLDVRVGYLGHGRPPLEETVGDDTVVVPVLLARGYHAAADLPQRARRSRLARPVGPDGRLAVALADRLREAGYAGGTPVVLAAAGSTDPQAVADVETAAGALAGRLGASVTAAFVAGGSPRLADVTPGAVASYLVGPGAFAATVQRCGAPVVGRPIGDHPVLARIVLDRYDEALAGGRDQVPGRTAPA